MPRVGSGSDNLYVASTEALPVTNASAGRHVLRSSNAGSAGDEEVTFDLFRVALAEFDTNFDQLMQGLRRVLPMPE